MTGFVRNLEMIWVHCEPSSGFTSNPEQTWVRVEPRADLGSRRAQSRPGFASSPEQTWVRVEPKVDLGSRQTQSKSGFLMNLVMAKLMRGKARKNGWKWWTNPDRLWVPHEPSQGQADEGEREKKWLEMVAMAR
ncbi:hypothetical protein SLEP1_g31558 [Rubroshorea leprosula]|uniref:Uncharacterized protein n=1 Tax=Rubroshorea leprosula TaxID=152421 RepID=A0AAV5K8P4_9ROSI|nr:hypothetical protein SLEP1_g31558 [Rubroshorea leprosula]